MSSPTTLDGALFQDLDGFYQTIYSLMQLYDDWTPGHSLDALNDMLYSGFGKAPITLFWRHSEKSREDLGIQATRRFYQYKIDQGKPFNTELAKRQLEELNSGKGPTLFEIIVDILQTHRHITLVLC